MTIETRRLRLRPWQEDDRPAFAALHADPEVMADLGGPIDRVASDAKFDRYVANFARHGISRWAVTARDGDFLGYAGVTPEPDSHPLGRHCQVGWRFARRAWGHGYATEAASAALDDAFGRAGLREVLAYTAADNARSQAVMARLGLRRDSGRDFTMNGWHGLVWVARRA
ncbi:MAG: GNAT family N-acetyltransferase [Reyranella sp.]|uniref:GNAT family N-acetyltransferase n=1 Tax=Reyranella sp. TaxID=1929291 RepID=UPI003D0F514C